MQCSHCGAANHDGARFCGSCGKPIDAPPVKRGDPDRARGERARLHDFLIGTFKHTHHVDLEGTALQRIAEVVTKAHAEHEKDPRLGLDVNMPFLAVTSQGPVHFNMQLTGDELHGVFDGVLEAPSDDEGDDDDEDDDKAETATRRAERKSAGKRRRAESVAREQQRDLERAKERQEKAEKKAAEKRSTTLVALGVIGMLSAIFIAIVFTHEKKEHDKEKKSEEGHARAAATSTAASIASSDVPVLAPPTTVAVPSCSCVSRGDSLTNTFVLQAPTEQGSSWLVDWTQVAGFTSMHDPFALRSGDAGSRAVLPPADGVTKLRMAVACDGDIVAFVSGGVASAWAGSDHGAMIWSTKLPAPLARPSADAPVMLQGAASGAAIDVACSQVLHATAGVVALKLESGRRVSLSMHDGTVN